VPDWRCPHCSEPLTRSDFASNPPHTCRHCGREFDAPVDVEAVEATASVVGVGPRARGFQGPPRPPGHDAPGGPGPHVNRGRTIYMRLDSTGNGTGCSGCGCLLLVLFFAVLLRACL
jgi:hypothetical protein